MIIDAICHSCCWWWCSFWYRKELLYISRLEPLPSLLLSQLCHCSTSTLSLGVRRIYFLGVDQFLFYLSHFIIPQFRKSKSKSTIALLILLLLLPLLMFLLTLLIRTCTRKKVLQLFFYSYCNYYYGVEVFFFFPFISLLIYVAFVVVLSCWIYCS